MMSKLQASFVLRIIAAIFALIGISLFYWSLTVVTVTLRSFTIISTVISTPDEAISLFNMGPILAGLVPLLVGIVGPLRIALIGAQVPAEIMRTIVVVGICLLSAGIALIAAGLYSTAWTNSLAFLICGICAITSAYTGFYSLSKRLPDTFYISEMLVIMKSAGIMGKKEDSVANREFMRWSKGIRVGVAVGKVAPDGLIVTLKGETVRLSEFSSKQNDSFSPLVLNFGSYSCPHHRKRIGELHMLMDKWKNQGVRFLTVYTAEAHPEDGWRLANQYEQDKEYTGNAKDFCFFHAKTLDERQHMANWLIEKKKFRMPVVLDTMKNSLLSAYNSW